MQETRLKRNYRELVLTGGPSAGKTSTLAYLREELSERGVRVIFRPEVATMLIQGGITDIDRLAGEQRERYFELQRAILLLEHDMRAHYRRLAATFAPEPVLIVYDRGQMDVAAYVSDEEFQAMLSEHGLTLTDVRDSYDAVIHLHSAAVGAPEHYTTANNPARREQDVEMAARADERTLKAWLGHPHLWVVKSREDFDAKRAEVARIALHTLGMPAPVEIERKFLLASEPDPAHPVLAEAVAIEIEQHYLRAPEGVELRVRRRSQAGQETYYRTEKRRGDGIEREEHEAIITPTEYLRLLAERDPGRRPLRKTRYCFIHAGHQFELDRIERPGRRPLWLLEVELLDSGAELVLPDFLEIEREVSDDPTYSSASLSAAV